MRKNHSLVIEELNLSRIRPLAIPTTPKAMFTRIAMSNVAIYEIIISIGVLIGSTVGIGILSAKIYRVGVLLYGVPPKFLNIIKMIFKKS